MNDVLKMNDSQYPNIGLVAAQEVWLTAPGDDRVAIHGSV
jgi:hypothetical protein